MQPELLLNGLTILEIVGVEFWSVWTLSKKKHGFFAVLGSYTAITATLLLFMVFVAVKLPGYGNGSGRFMVLGVLYFIPIMIHFGGDWKSRLIIAFFSFSYGLAGFAVSVRVGYLFSGEWLTYSVFVIQTLLYAITFPFYLQYSRQRIVPYIEKANRVQKNILIRYTIVSFLLIIAFNGTMTTDGSVLKKLLVYLMLIYFIILSYRLMASYLKADDDNQELNELVITDKLTGLGNRRAFYGRAEMLMEKGRPFYLHYMDLNRFKSVNDRYGHNTGDLYLKNFADALGRIADENTEFYRLSGDEFTCLTTEGEVMEALESLSVEPAGKATFLGFSVGRARFPEDGTSLSGLLEQADKRMYLQKKKGSAKGRNTKQN